jgi:hypothetical protein
MISSLICISVLILGVFRTKQEEAGSLLTNKDVSITQNV